MKIDVWFTAPLWQHSAPGGWHFVSLPSDLSQEIRFQVTHLEEGWGRLKVTATVDGQTWNTSIWYDKKLGTYLLPIKSNIRKALSIKLNDGLSVMITY